MAADDPAAKADPEKNDPPAAGGGSSGDEDLDAILKDAKNPDAVKNAIDRQKETAKAEKKRADDLAAKLKEIEDRDLSEKDKAEKRAAEAEQAATAAQARLLRFEVAADKKVPADLADLLQGATKEELEASAEKLLKHVKAGSGGQLDGGARGTTTSTTDMDTLIRKAAGRA
jgi:hypothetical protein